MSIRTTLLVALLLGSGYTSVAQVDVTLPLVGKIRPRSSQEIASSSWSIGGETLDRDFAIYKNYKEFLGPLGAKAIRFQAGWAKCEKKSGIYDWAWLDEAVDDARAQGVQPWLEFSYGNPIYAGGGDPGLGGGFPSSPEALAAWGRWVRATVEHFKVRVHQWEVWNEPDGNRQGTATVSAYIELYIRTATIVREIQPSGTSQIYALALAGGQQYTFDFIDGMSKRQKLDLIDAVTIHGYPKNPDDTEIFDKLREKLAATGHSIQIREGESGAPSKYSIYQALNRLPWTETMQAKWDLRRMLVFRSKNVPFNLFTLMDLDYRVKGDHEMAYFGMLASREDPPDGTVVYVKPAYYAAQNIFAIFDDSVVRMTNATYAVTAPNSLAGFAFENKNTGGQLLALWLNGAMPSDFNAKTRSDVTVSGMHFDDPVYVDLLTGKVFALSKAADGLSFKDIPLYDSPILIADRKALPIEMTAARYCGSCDGQVSKH